LLRQYCVLKIVEYGGLWQLHEWL